MGWQRQGAGRRVEFRQEFISILAAEQRASVIDFGAGPGQFTTGFGDYQLHRLRAP